MAEVRVVLMTCEKYSWCLQPFAYLFNTYWSSMQNVVIGGVRDTRTGLPKNFSFICKTGCNYGPNKSDSLIATLQEIPDDIVVIMLEDYLLCRTVDCGGINTLADFMRDNPNVIRMDLTTDRLYGAEPAFLAIDGCG